MTLDAATETKLIDAVRMVAAEEILPRFRALDPSDIAMKSRHDDLVTAADRAAEARLTDVARTILPGVAVVGEEAVADDPSVRDQIATSEISLIIDPVDGTWNFANGLSTFGVILSIAKEGRTIWGLIYDPVGDDWAIARKGQGAEFVTANGTTRPLKLSTERPAPLDATMGYVHSYLFLGDERRRLFAVLPDLHKTDALRCSAHEYRLMTRGAVDFCLSPVLNPWDHAAGCLIVEEAGGVARLLDGTPYNPTLKTGRLLVARSEDVWQKLAVAFRPLNAGG